MFGIKFIALLPLPIGVKKIDTHPFWRNPIMDLALHRKGMPLPFSSSVGLNPVDTLERYNYFLSVIHEEEYHR
jgi:hypothetical protein